MTVGASTNVVLSWNSLHSVPKGSFYQIQFPKWNQGNPTLSAQKTFIQGAVSCSPIVVLSSKLDCSFQDDTLTISGSVTSDITANTTISILVTGFKNPINTSVFTGFKVTSMIKSGVIFYPIDTGMGTLQITDYAAISQGTLEVRYPELSTAGLIQQADDMKLSFYLPVPLDKGCKVTVVLPQQYSINDVQTVGSLQVFGYYKQYTVADGTLTINNKTNSFTFSPCDTYKENDNIAVIYISKLMQYKFEYPCDSLKISIDTQQGFKVAQIQSGISFTPRRGATQATAKASISVVQSLTDLTLNLYPQNKIYASDLPQVVIVFPPEIRVISCTVKNDQSGKIVCQRDSTNGQMVTLKNFLQSDYTPGDAPIQLSFGDIINPPSTKPPQGFDIVILAQGRYAIDEYNGPSVWNLTTGNISQVVINPGNSYQADKPNNIYTISFTPQHAIPLNGYVEIQIPSEIILPDLSYTSSSCSAPQPQGFPIEQITCQILNYTNNSGYFVLQVLNAFRRSQGSANANYLLTLPGVTNPIRTTPTKPFIINTLTNDNYKIDSYIGSSIQMLISAEMKDFQLKASSLVNSQIASFRFTMVPTVQISQNMYVLITFPPQMKLPQRSSDLACSTSYTNIISSVNCILNSQNNSSYPNTVRVAMTLVNSVIIAYDRFGFTISGVQNPPTTQSTDSVQARIVDSQTYAVVNQYIFGTFVTTNQPSPISKASIITSTYQPGVPTQYQINFYPEHQIKVGGGVLVTIPSQISSNIGVNFGIQAIVSNQTTDQQLIWINPQASSSRQKFIENIVQGNDFIPGPQQMIQVIITGLNTPYTNELTDSFQVSTFNIVNGMYFFIDTVNSGLYIKSECSYPCSTCVQGQPSNCTSCFLGNEQHAGLPFLQLGTCVSACNFGRFYNNQTKQCEQCDQSCLTCNGTAQNCTTCGQTQYPFFYKNKCLTTCPSGFLGIVAANQCQKCAYPCSSCEKTITTCTSCDINSSLPLLYSNQCLGTCPALISVKQNNICVKCDSSCAVCSGTPQNCTSCAQHMKYDPINHICTAQCQPETQIYNPLQQRCDRCNETCYKCNGDINKCTQCMPGYVLNKDFTCQPTCKFSPNEISQTAVRGVCLDCKQPCKTCNGQVDICSSCDRDPIKYLLYQNKQCVQYCPNKYNVSDDGLSCQYIGLICPQNFQPDAFEMNCIPIYYECAEGYELNENKSACIPLPGSPVPFPFLIAAVFVSFLVLGSYLKEKFFTKVYTCLIFIIGSFEIVMYVLMVAFSCYAKEWAIAILCLIGLVSLIIANVVFTIYYNREILAGDQVFSKWLFFFPKTKKLIPVASMLINFKCSKLLYSGLYGMEATMAKFGKPLEFYRIIQMVSYFSYIFTYGSIFIADFVIFARIKWGYQLLVLGCESLILGILIVVLTYLESRSPPAELLQVGTSQYTTIKPRGGEVRVKGGIEFDSNSDYEEGIPDIDETMLIRTKEEYQKREVNLRNLALHKIVKQIQQNISVKEDGCKIQEVETKFADLKLRRAFSMNSNTNAGDGEWSAEDLNSGVDANSQQDYNDQIKSWIRERRFSWPLLQQTQQLIPVEQFQNQVTDIILADDEYLIDNVYKEVRVHKSKLEQQKQKKLVSRRTQTYLRELLHLDGLDINDSDQSLIMDDEAEIDETYAQGLISDVLQNVSGNEEEVDFEEQMQEESLIQFNIQKNEPIEYDLKDIMGEFEVDDLGNFIIIRKAESMYLFDKQGRLVNRRGYLVDRQGNVINTKGHMIFKKLELDDDDEIPAPFEQVENKLKYENFNIVNNDAPINSETKRNSSLFEQMGQNSNQQEVGEQEELNKNEEDLDLASSSNNLGNLIDKITKQKVPKKRSQLRSQERHESTERVRPTHQIMDNLPPKRFQQIYPMIGIINEEQQRLAVLANKIGGHTQKIIQDSGMLTGRESISEVLSNQTRFRMIKEQTLNELMSPDSQRQLLSQRPNSVYNERSSHNKIRSQTGNAIVKSRPPRNRETKTQSNKLSLQKIYQNIDQLVGLEEQQLQQLQVSNADSRLGNRRMTQNEDYRLNGLESIYLKKSTSQVKNLKTVAAPFRPTMQQYVDDPNELIVATGMDGIRFGQAQARDVSLLMADRVDQLQRNYLKLNQSEANLSEYRLPQQVQIAKENPRVVRHDNWLQ